MPCIKFGSPDGPINDIVCLASFYVHEYQEQIYYIEWHPYFGGHLVRKKDLAPYKKMGKKRWAIVEDFMKIPEDKRKELE
jgi:hypothetical protein